MSKTDTELYLEAINKNLLCPKQIRKKYLSQLSADINEMAEMSEKELTMADLEEHFGTPQEIASEFLSQTDASDLSHLVSKKKSAVLIVIITGLIILLTVFIYIRYDRHKKELFENGYSVETAYETVEGTPPPEPEGTRVY